MVVLEQAASPGGAVRTAEVTVPGFRNDLYSAFYPLTAASPVMRRLRLEEHGLRWSTPPWSWPTRARTGPQPCWRRPRGDGGLARRRRAGGRRGVPPAAATRERVGPSLVAALLSPFPPVLGAARLARATIGRDARDTARMAIVPLRRMVEEHFSGEAARLLYAGSALHADLTPDSAGSALFGWLMVGLGQQVGFPVPEGGAERITDALVGRLTAAGGRESAAGVAGRRASSCSTGGPSAVRRRTANASNRRAGRCIADVDARICSTASCCARTSLPAGVRRSVGRVAAPDPATLKVDWALSGADPVDGAPRSRTSGTRPPASTPWTRSPVCGGPTGRRAGARPAPGAVSARSPAANPSRSPAGTEAVWAYVHVPNGWPGPVNDVVEHLRTASRTALPGSAPSCSAATSPDPPTSRVPTRTSSAATSPPAASASTQLIWRPMPGLAHNETPVAWLFLASASAHPGAGHHRHGQRRNAGARPRSSPTLRRACQVSAPLRRCSP